MADEGRDYQQERDDEVEVIESMYGAAYSRLPEDDTSVYTHSVFIEPDVPEGQGSAPSPVELRWGYPKRYPDEIPAFDVGAEWMTGEGKSLLEAELRRIFEENESEVVIFTWVEWVKEQTVDVLGVRWVVGLSVDVTPVAYDTDSDDEVPLSPLPEGVFIPDVFHSERITDRKSKFVAHAAVIHSMAEHHTFMQVLATDRKIMRATHNIMAYRLKSGDGPVDEGRDDDGEHRAGDGLLNLLQRMGIYNVVVVVSRWYGGKHLGADRFKHINACARSVLVDMGLVEGEGPAAATVNTREADDHEGMKRKMRPADEVYKRIEYDPELDPDDFIIGYEDRFTGVQEVPYYDFVVDDDFAYEGIPFHRIRFYKHHGEIVWDRTNRVDKLYSENAVRWK